MKVEKRRELVPERVVPEQWYEQVVYVAEDGREFYSKDECMRYEAGGKIRTLFPNGEGGLCITIETDYRTFGYEYTFDRQILVTDANCPGLWFAKRIYRYIHEGWLGDGVIAISDEGVERIIKEALDMQRRINNVTIEIDTKE